jgi:ribosomal protein L37AE/L43A
MAAGEEVMRRGGRGGWPGSSCGKDGAGGAVMGEAATAWAAFSFKFSFHFLLQLLPVLN